MGTNQLTSWAWKCELTWQCTLIHKVEKIPIMLCLIFCNALVRDVNGSCPDSFPDPLTFPVVCFRWNIGPAILTSDLHLGWVFKPSSFIPSCLMTDQPVLDLDMCSPAQQTVEVSSEERWWIRRINTLGPTIDNLNPELNVVIPVWPNCQLGSSLWTRTRTRTQLSITLKRGKEKGRKEVPEGSCDCLQVSVISFSAGPLEDRFWLLSAKYT